MKEFIFNLFNHKSLYLSSASIGSVIAFIVNFFSNTPSEILGISISLWLVVFIINVYDIHTGIKADTVRKQSTGGKFVFESRKGWRAIEKIFVFTVAISFMYNFETELVRLDMPGFLSYGMLVIKLSTFFYLVLVELQSIGENNEVRFGKKDKIFQLLDNIIAAINEGVIGYVKGMFNKKPQA